MYYLYPGVEGYDGGVTSASAYMYYDCVVRITESCSVLVHRYNDVRRSSRSSTKVSTTACIPCRPSTFARGCECIALLR